MRRIAALLLVLITNASAAERQFLQGHVVRAVTELHLQPAGRLASSTNLDLVIGLPLRNQEALTNLLQQQYAPTSSQYHHWLTPDEFAARFGPMEDDYQTVIDFAKANGFTITGTHSNRTLVDVRGSVADIERTFHVALLTYQHPSQTREFYAPDSEPSLDLTIPVLHIGGLNNYVVPRPLSISVGPQDKTTGATPAAGSGPAGSYRGSDFRAAYAPGVSLNGSGQVVGLIEFDGYDASDITEYATQAKLPGVPLRNVLVDGASGSPDDPDQVLEVSLDIEMVISMAPELDEVVVYEARQGSDSADVLNRIATDDLARQISCSWFLGDDDSLDQIYQQFAAQGQSFFQASGDNGAFSSSWPDQQQTDTPYVTLVGGTELTTGAGATWRSEAVWNRNNGTGRAQTNDASGGGISSLYSIPSWQQELDMTVNQGSTSMRNIPDVAMAAADVYVIFNSGSIASDVAGTSVAAPLWAGFAALVNEQAVTDQQPPAGFINPAIYAIGAGSNYTACFHDITTGNNKTFYSPTRFSAVSGYDLCTGWGSPTGSNLINALVGTTNTPFAALCHDVTTNADGNCEANVPVSAVDNGSYSTVGTIVSRTLNPPGPYPRGVTQVTLSITDSRGNSSSCSAFVTVLDETAPSIACPGTFVTNVPPGVTRVTVVYPTPPASDNCGLQTVSCTPPSGSIFRLGTTPVVCTAIDIDGNTNTCMFNVSVMPATNACLFTLGTTSATLLSKGGSQSVSVKVIGSDCSWTAVSNDPFITITSGTNGTGSGTVRFTVPANTNTVALSGTMTIAGQTFTVNQDAGGCTYTFSPKFAKFRDTGGKGTVRVTPNFSDCDWTAVSNDSFISVTEGNTGADRGTVRYTVATNTSAEVLSGSITIGGETFAVEQTAAPCELSLDQTTASFGSAGGADGITVTANGPDCTWKAVVSGSFIQITTAASGTGSGIVDYTVEANTRTTTRKGTITVGKERLTITQLGAP
jgi:pro-kumamolisin-like protein/HYR domain-containing protein/all-beta uncharacterized protein